MGYQDYVLDEQWFTISTAEYVVIGIGATVHFINLLVVCFVLYHRDYAPLKVRQIPLVIVALFSGIIWWIGALTTLRLIDQTNVPALLICDFWAVWVQLVFGLCLWTSCLLYRLWKLYWIAILLKAADQWKFRASFLMFWSPIIIYGIFCSIFKVDGPVLHHTGNEICEFEDVPLYCFFIILAADLFALIFFLVRLRNLKQKYLQEYKENLITFFVFTICYVVYLVLLGTQSQFYIWGRCINTMIVLLVPTLAFYVTIGAPAVHCIYKREEYYQAFISQMKSFSVSTDRQKKDDVFDAAVAISEINGESSNV